MTIEERLAAVERELEHQREMAKLRAIADDLATSRVERVEGKLEGATKVLPRLQAAMKELEEASIVTAHLQARQAAMLKEHAEWLQSHDRAMSEMDKHRAEDRERGRALDERIEKLVSAIGEMLRKKNGK